MIVARREPTDSVRRDAFPAIATASVHSTISVMSRPDAASVAPTPTAGLAANVSLASGTSLIANAVSVTDTRTAATQRPGPASTVEISPPGTIATVALTIFMAIRELA